MSSIINTFLSDLEKCNKLHNYLNDCIDNLMGKEFPTYKENNYTDNDIDKIKRAVQHIYRQLALSHNVDCDIEQNILQQIEKCFNDRQEDIILALYEEIINNHDQTIIKNFDWKLKWILGGSNLSNFKKPLLNIDFYCKKKEDNHIYSFEITLEQLNNLINEMEIINEQF